MAMQAAKDVVLEDTRASEEATLVNRHRIPRKQFRLDQFDAAAQVRQLKQLVVLRANRLCECDAVSKVRRKRVVKKIRHGGLSAVVVDLHGVKGVRIQRGRRQKLRELISKSLHNLARGRDEHGGLRDFSRTPSGEVSKRRRGEARRWRHSDAARSA